MSISFEFWKDSASGVVYGYDVSDSAQVAARDERLKTGSFVKVNEPTPVLSPEQQAMVAAKQAVRDKLAALGLTIDDLKALGL